MDSGITLFGMTEKGLAVLRAIDRDFPQTLTAVVAARDPGNKRDCYEEIKQYCGQHHIEFYDRADPFDLASRYALVVSWRWLIDAPRDRLIVFHDSLLPRYRGFNPLVSMLINGDRQIGVTALYGAAEFDHGDIISQSESTISYPIRIQEAIRVVVGNYEVLARQVVGMIARGEPLPAKPQDENEATYSLWRDDEDYFIDWNQPAHRIKRMIDAVGHPYAGAATRIAGRVARILDAEVVTDVNIEDRTPGKVMFVFEEGPVIVCGQGLLKITKAVDDESGQSVLPLPRFRMRLK